MDRDRLFGDLALLARVATAGSITSAAAQAGMAKSSVSARIAGLEATVGARLLTRSRRGVRPTPAGETLLEAGRRIAGEAEAALAEVRAGEDAVAGILCLSCPAGIADVMLVPLLSDLLARHPALRLDLVATDRIVDPRQEGVDVAFRLGWLRGAESGLVARRLGGLEGVLCASPRYLEAAGGPLRSAADLSRHAWIGYAGFGGPQQALVLRDGAGRRHEAALECRVRTTSALQMKEWALAGLGVTRLPRLVVQTEFDRGQLVRVLPDHSFEGPSLFALYPRDRYRPARVRALLSLLKLQGERPRMRART
jgi:DNA-binding transcriptional LysR family regulator